MDINSWVENINYLKIDEFVKNNILRFFNNFYTKKYLSIIPVQDNDLLDAFNNINNYKPLSICLDIEFQSALIDKKDKKKYLTSHTIKKDLSAKFIREFAMMFFIKTLDDIWYYIGSIFINFQPLTYFGFDLKNLSFISFKYSSVNQNTLNLMIKLENDFHLENLLQPLFDENLFDSHNHYIEKIDMIKKSLTKNYLFKNISKELNKTNILNSFKKLSNIYNFSDALKELYYIEKQLHKIQYDIYGKYLNVDFCRIFKNINKLYWNDYDVIQRTNIIKNKYDVFFKDLTYLFKDSVIIIKGMMDILAIKNTNKLICNNDIDINFYYDIETFNGFSYLLYNNSQLEETYNNLIKTDVYLHYAKSFFNQIQNIGDKAHNPLVDSLFTIVVAVIINLGLNKYFKNIIGGSKKMYYSNYIKTKQKYLDLKNTA